MVTKEKPKEVFLDTCEPFPVLVITFKLTRERKRRQENADRPKGVNVVLFILVMASFVLPYILVQFRNKE